MQKKMDVLIVGAGPAGLSAAVEARECGLDVTVVDEQPKPGGQLLRNVEHPITQPLMDPKELKMGLDLVNRFYKSGAVYLPDTIVWGLEPHKAYCNIAGEQTLLTPSTIIIASGAMERPVPFPGWTLPGVMGAGGADILLRCGGTLTKDPGEPVVMAGNGPLLLLLACHMLELGVNIAAWLDTGNWSKRIMSAGVMPTALFDLGYMGKGLKMALKIVKGRIPIIPGVDNICAEGDGALEKVRFTVRGEERELPASVLLRHEGIIPRTHIANSMEIEHKWDNLQRCWYPLTDENGATSIDGVYIAGDGAYVHGGDVSLDKGLLAGIEAARHLGIIDDKEAAFRREPIAQRMRRIRRGRSYLDYVFAPNPKIFQCPDETLVCRCESVTAGAIRQAVRDGYTDVNSIKQFTRCGMGHCQGRMCGPGLAEIAADAAGMGVDEVGSLRIRQPFRPVSLKDYCDLNTEQA